MDIHKPKPWHGWREFLKEFGTIVLGVLVALGAEQAVEWLHNQHNLTETREAIREELVRNASYADIGAREDRCLLGKLDRYEQWARGGLATTETPFLNPYFTTTVWDASQSGAVSRMPLKEKFAYAEFYEQARNLQTMVATQRGQVSALVKFMDLGTLNTTDARDLLKEVSAARRTLEYKIFNERALVGAAKALGESPRPIPQNMRRELSFGCQYGGLAPPDFNKPLSAPPETLTSGFIAELKKHD